MTFTLPWRPPFFFGLLLLAGWFVLGVTDGPGPVETARAAWTERTRIFPVIGTDSLAMLIGLLAGLALGLGGSLLMMRMPALRPALWPWIAAGSLAPMLTLAPLAALLTPNALIAATTMVTLCSTGAIVAATTPALVATNPLLLNLFRSYRANLWQEIRFLRLPHALPSLLAGARRAAILAPAAALLTDFLAGPLAGRPGAGSLLMHYRESGNDAALLALCLTALITGLAFAGAVHALANWTLRHWHDGIALAKS